MKRDGERKSEGVTEGAKREVWRGRIVPRAMVPSEAGTAKGWRLTPSPLHYPSRHHVPASHPICFCFPCTTHPPALKEERENGGRGERNSERDRGEMVCQYSLCLRRKRRDREKEKNGSETRRWEYTCGKRATRGTQEFTATSAHVKDWRKRKLKKKMCRRTNAVGRLN